MTKQDAQALKEKFDGLMLAVETFGGESKQLAQARKDLKGLAKEFQSTGQRLAEVTARCQDYLDAANQLISDGFTQQIRQDIETTSDIIRQCQQQSEEMTAQYRELLASFAEDAGKLDERQAAIIRAVQEGSSIHREKLDILTRNADRNAASVKAELQAHAKALEEASVQSSQILTAALGEKAARLEEHQQQAAKELLETAKSELRKYAEKGQESLSTETARLSGELLAIGGSLEQLDGSVSRAFAEKTAYLEEKQRQSTLELLKAIQRLDQKLDRLSDTGGKLEALLTAQTAAHQAQSAQIAERLKKQWTLMLAGMGVLTVLAVLGLFIL